jgi:hypothetical protein
MAKDICRMKAPELRLAEGGDHFAACHLIT